MICTDPFCDEMKTEKIGILNMLRKPSTQCNIENNMDMSMENTSSQFLHSDSGDSIERDDEHPSMNIDMLASEHGEKHSLVIAEALKFLNFKTITNVEELNREEPEKDSESIETSSKCALAILSVKDESIQNIQLGSTTMTKSRADQISNHAERKYENILNKFIEDNNLLYSSLSPVVVVERLHCPILPWTGTTVKPDYQFTISFKQESESEYNTEDEMKLIPAFEEASVSESIKEDVLSMRSISLDRSVENEVQSAECEHTKNNELLLSNSVNEEQEEENDYFSREILSSWYANQNVERVTKFDSQIKTRASESTFHNGPFLLHSTKSQRCESLASEALMEKDQIGLNVQKTTNCLNTNESETMFNDEETRNIPREIKIPEQVVKNQESFICSFSSSDEEEICLPNLKNNIFPENSPNFQEKSLFCAPCETLVEKNCDLSSSTLRFKVNFIPSERSNVSTPIKNAPMLFDANHDTMAECTQDVLMLSEDLSSENVMTSNIDSRIEGNMISDKIMISPEPDKADSAECSGVLPDKRKRDSLKAKKNELQKNSHQREANSREDIETENGSEKLVNSSFHVDTKGKTGEVTANTTTKSTKRTYMNLVRLVKNSVFRPISSSTPSNCLSTNGSMHNEKTTTVFNADAIARRNLVPEKINSTIIESKYHRMHLRSESSPENSAYSMNHSKNSINFKKTKFAELLVKKFLKNNKHSYHWKYKLATLRVVLEDVVHKSTEDKSCFTQLFCPRVVLRDVMELMSKDRLKVVSEKSVHKPKQTSSEITSNVNTMKHGKDIRLRKHTAKEITEVVKKYLHTSRKRNSRKKSIPRRGKSTTNRIKRNSRSLKTVGKRSFTQDQRTHEKDDALVEKMKGFVEPSVQLALENNKNIYNCKLATMEVSLEDVLKKNNRRRRR